MRQDDSHGSGDGQNSAQNNETSESSISVSSESSGESPRARSSSSGRRSQRGQVRFDNNSIRYKKSIALRRRLSFSTDEVLIDPAPNLIDRKCRGMVTGTCTSVDIWFQSTSASNSTRREARILQSCNHPSILTAMGLVKFEQGSALITEPCREGRGTPGR